MPPLKAKNKPTAAKEDEWEDEYLQTKEKGNVNALLQFMHLPGYDEECDLADVDKICDKLCLGLKKKHPRWERFLLERDKKKCEKFKGLENHVYDYIIKIGNQKTTRR
jgi:hypothetical protein